MSIDFNLLPNQTAGSTPTEALSLRLSERGYIDSSEHSLYDISVNPQIDGTSFTERIHLISSWSEDMLDKQHYLYRRLLQSGCQPVSRVKDPFTGKTREMLNFASNDYLNLTQHPRVVKAAIESLQDYGAGAGGVPMLSGSLQINRELELKLANMKGCEDALVYTSGFGANVGVMSALLRKQDLAIIDSLAHASLLDGANVCTKQYFNHNDLGSLESILTKARTKFTNKLVVLDGVYSMDGDIARLDEIVELAHAYGAWVLVDEAHATGVIGRTGGGTPEYFDLLGKTDIVTGTLSKAIGCVGGFVAGSKALITYLQATSRPYIFSTAPFAAVSAAALEACHVIEEEPEIRERLWQNVNYFRHELIALGFKLGNSETAIFPLILGDDLKVKDMTSRLHQAGILANPVLFPAVARHLARVRLTVTAGMERRHLDQALEAITGISKIMRLI